VVIALATLPLLEDREDNLVLAAVKAALLAASDFSLVFKAAGVKAQELMIDPTSSSYFLHFPKAFLQVVTALANAEASVDNEQFFIIVDALERVSLAQQVQAVPLLSFLHSSSFVEKEVIAVVQVVISVKFG